MPPILEKNEYEAMSSEINSLLSMHKNLHETIQKKSNISHPISKMPLDIFDKGMFLGVAVYDLITSLKHLDFAIDKKDEMESNFFSRVILLISYELINYNHKALNKELFAFVSSNFTDQVVSESKEFSTRINDLKSDNIEIMRFVRNNLIGHRISNGMDMISGMNKINSTDTFKLGSSLFSIYIKILTYHMRIISDFMLKEYISEFGVDKLSSK